MSYSTRLVSDVDALSIVYISHISSSRLKNSRAHESVLVTKKPAKIAKAVAIMVIPKRGFRTAIKHEHTAASDSLYAKLVGELHWIVHSRVFGREGDNDASRVAGSSDSFCFQGDNPSGT